MNSFLNEADIFPCMIVQSTFIFEFRAAIPAGIWPQLVVDLRFVPVQTVCLEKLFITLVALVHFLFFVNFSDVSPQSVGLRKRFVTI